MKRKTKVLIIAGACLLVVGVGTGITVHNVKVNTSTMESDMSVSESTAEGEGKTDKANVDATSRENGKADSSDSEKTSSESSRVVANDNKNSTEGRTTASERQTTTEHRTEGRTEGRTTESRTEARTETTTEGKRVEPTTETPNTEHTHNWVAVYKTVHHDATYKEEKYVVREAWDEEVTDDFYVCNRCGVSFRCIDANDPTSPVYNEFTTHIFTCQYNNPNWEGMGPGSNYHGERRVIGSVHHDAEYGTRQVIDKPAWDEQVIDYYKCSCGATKK